MSAATPATWTRTFDAAFHTAQQESHLCLRHRASQYNGRIVARPSPIAGALRRSAHAIPDSGLPYTAQLSLLDSSGADTREVLDLLMQHLATIINFRPRLAPDGRPPAAG